MTICVPQKFHVESEDVSPSFVNSRFCQTAFHLKGKFYDEIPQHDEPYCSLTKPLSESLISSDLFSIQLSPIKIDILENINDTSVLSIDKAFTDTSIVLDQISNQFSTRVLQEAIVSDQITLHLVKGLTAIITPTDINSKRSVKLIEDLAYFDLIYVNDSYTNSGISTEDSITVHK